MGSVHHQQRSNGGGDLQKMGIRFLTESFKRDMRHGYIKCYHTNFSIVKFNKMTTKKISPSNSIWLDNSGNGVCDKVNLVITQLTVNLIRGS